MKDFRLMKQMKKAWNFGKYKKNIYSVVHEINNPVVAFSLGAVTIMMVDTWFDEPTTNFVSAGANVAMALIAYKALLVGRDYVGQMMIQEGYKRALNFNNKSFVSFIELVKIMPDFEFTIGYINGIRSQMGPTNAKTLKEINDTIRNMFERLSKIDTHLYSLRMELKKIRTYGFTLTEEKNESFTLIANSYRALHESITNLTYSIKYINSWYKFDVEKYNNEDEILSSPPPESLALLSFLAHLDDITITELKKAKTAVNDLYRGINDYNSNGDNIKKYFIKELV